MSIVRRVSTLVIGVALAAGAVLALPSCGGPRMVDESWSEGHPKRHGQVVGGLQEGDWSYWYDNGQPQATGAWKGDKQIGAWTWWWPNGEKQSEGQYAEGGTRTGHWRQYHDSGKLASEGDYDRNRQDGLWRYAYPDGSPYAEGFFDFGAKSGLWRTWNRDGSVQSQGAYFLGLKVGPWHEPGAAEPIDHGAPKGFIVSRLTVDGQALAWAMTRVGRDEAAADHLLAFPLGGCDGACLLGQFGGAMRYASNLGGRGMAQAWNEAGVLVCAGHSVDGLRDGRWLYRSGGDRPAEWVEFQRGQPMAGLADQHRLIATIDERTVRVARAAGTVGDGALGAALAKLGPETAAPGGAKDEKAGVDQTTAVASDAVTPAPSTPAFAQAATAVAPSAAAADATTPFGDEASARPAAAASATAPIPTIAMPVAAQPNQLDLSAPDPTAPSLSPMQVLPSFWTNGEEKHAASFIQRYSTGSVNEAADDPYAVDPSVKSQRPDLLAKPLPQTRFLGADGKVIDLGMYQKPVVVVLLRGFGGQVCLYCAAQTAALAKRIGDFHQAGAEVVVVYPGPAEAAPAFIQAVKTLSKDPPPMPVALDISLLLVRALGIEDNLARPTSLVLDKGGKVRFAYVGKTIADRPSADDLLREVRRIVE